MRNIQLSIYICGAPGYLWQTAMADATRYR